MCIFARQHSLVLKHVHIGCHCARNVADTSPSSERCAAILRKYVYISLTLYIVV